ncbi:MULTISPECIES: TetR/AcrR family transcriptional regulator [Sciscionella]|uniref:TetR/AcrR family transcriptional regulator n=1 Tax=Sciscionella TaxID=596495 RepID=UPI00037641D3|nr:MULTISPECIES: TetR/AcrR family transcriptional regulator [Sciscionella]
MRSRRLEYSESTRKALVDSAIELITKRGYAGTSLDEIAKRARVTKGALYHHFSGKQALFEAAFDAVERDVMARVAKILEDAGDRWEVAMSGVRAYLRTCLEPTYQRIVLNEGPVVMGWERWREAEDQFSFGLFRNSVESLINAGIVASVAPVEATARLLFGAVSAGAQYIVGAADQKQTYNEVATAIERLFGMLRTAAAVERGEEPEQPKR